MLNVDADFVDRIFGQVESRLADAIEYLVARSSDDAIESVDAVPWATIIVPFASQLFARGIDYERRVANRASTTGLPPADSTTLALARLYDFVWLAGAVARASWTIMHAPEGKTFITNDVGRIPMADPGVDGTPRGFGIPLNRRAALMLTADPEHNARVWHDDARTIWFVWPLRHVVLNAKGVDTFNEAVARHAHMEIYGARRDDIEALHNGMASDPLDEETFEPIWIAMNPWAQMDVTYARIQRLISVPPSSVPALAGAFEAFPVFDVSPSSGRQWHTEHCRGKLWRMQMGAFIGLQAEVVDHLGSNPRKVRVRVLPATRAEASTKWSVRHEIERRPFGPELNPAMLAYRP